MISLLVGIVFILAIATMLSILGYWWQMYQYDKWIEEFNRKGIQLALPNADNERQLKTALEPVLYGSEVVGYTVVQERRCRGR